ncbi:hypothetical protein GQ53DRAFT_755066 [Thozetella sp. PMI_491]|nr:hypothetical protein GQ53DRAFT_755066 [Thozetella sp. PMI_491]
MSRAASLAVLLFSLKLSNAINPTSVFSIPPVATAGVRTPVEFNFNASSCSSPLSESQDCDWPYLKLWLMADPAYEQGVIVWRPYCTLSPCVSTNLSSFDITIPPSAVPDGYPYGMTYQLFRRDDKTGNYTFNSPIWSSFESTIFNITGANTTWNDYDKQSGRFSTDNESRSWWANLTCDALACVRECALKYEAPKVPYVAGSLPELDKCVEACPGMGWDPSHCITENAAAVTSATPSSSLSSTSSRLTSGTISETATAPTASTNASSRLHGSRYLAILSIIVAAVLFLLSM